jgi:YD repeat-containing protein
MPGVCEKPPIFSTFLDLVQWRAEQFRCNDSGKMGGGTLNDGRSTGGGRDLVENCLVLSVRSVCGGYSSGGREGVVRWHWGDQDIGAISYEINLWSAERGSLWLRYAAHGNQISRVISMTSTTLHSGGRRWWFVCPVTGERVGKLYLPEGATDFAGRKAHDLT